jgi:starch synthase
MITEKFREGRLEFMNILFATSEAAPFVKTGGLGDVAGSLPVTLKEKGVDVRVILPLYRCIPQEYKDKMKYIDNIYINIAWRKQYCGVFELEHEGCTYYFVDNEYYFNGDKPYGYIHEDCEKFIFFSKAVLSLLPTLGFRPDVINCNDWQTSPIPVFLDTFQDNPFYRGIKTVMTIHNLKFQGRWDFKGIKDVMGISDYYFTSDKLEYHKDANLLKGGIAYANRISTVSDSYAWEITTPEYGEGLNGLLSARRADITGIVNGISYTDWNPATDDMIFEKYDINTVYEKKKINKLKMQEQSNLPVDENKFLIGIVSRLTDQKGFDLLAGALDSLCNENVQIIILGTGDEKYENLFRHYAWKYPDKIAAEIYYSNVQSHKVYAACDAFLMPSIFEPCGLSQLISFRYGTLPIVRETGGLRDTVWPYNQYTGEGNGFSFANYSSNDMMYVIRYAMDIFYNHREDWNHIINNAMQCDYSWGVSADKYIKMYQELTGIYDLPEKKSEPAPVEKKPAKKAAPAPVKTEDEKLYDKKADDAALKKTIERNFKLDGDDVSVDFSEKEEAPKKTTKSTAKKTAAKKTTAKSTKKSTAKAANVKSTAAETTASAEKAAPKSETKTASKAAEKTPAKADEKAAVKADTTTAEKPKASTRGRKKKTAIDIDSLADA